MAAIWQQIDPLAARAVDRCIALPDLPRGALVAVGNSGEVAFLATDAVYQEVVLRALFGPEHNHYVFKEVQAPRVAFLPNINPDFLTPDARIRFDVLKTRMDALIDERTSVRAAPEAGAADGASCSVVTRWYSWPDSYDGWMRRTCVWRLRYEMHVVRDTRELFDLTISGPERMALTGFVEIGKRATEDPQKFQPVFRSGPLVETAFVPVGKKRFIEARRHFVSASRPGHPAIPAAAETSAATPRPAENPDAKLYRFLTDATAAGFLYADLFRRLHSALTDAIGVAPD